MNGRRDADSPGVAMIVETTGLAFFVKNGALRLNGHVANVVAVPQKIHRFPENVVRYRAFLEARVTTEGNEAGSHGPNMQIVHVANAGYALEIGAQPFRIEMSG